MQTKYLQDETVALSPVLKGCRQEESNMSKAGLIYMICLPEQSGEKTMLKTFLWLALLQAHKQLSTLYPMPDDLQDISVQS